MYDQTKAHMLTHAHLTHNAYATPDTRAHSHMNLTHTHTHTLTTHNANNTHTHAHLTH